MDPFLSINLEMLGNKHRQDPRQTPHRPSGRLSLWERKKRSRYWLGLVGIVFGGVLFYSTALWLSMTVYPLPSALLESDYSTLYLDSQNRLLRISLSTSEKYRIRLSLNEISDNVKHGFLAYEDKHFYHHPGVNPYALLRSALCNVRHGRVVMGGSTLTMQIAKMMEPKRRTFRSKMVEVFRALQLESRYSKDELFALYLNLIPMGGNIEGVGAASYLYFGKPARELSPGESALLIALPGSPNRYRPDLHPEGAQRRKAHILQQISPALNLPLSAVQENARRPIPTHRFINPYDAPHWVRRVSHMGNPFVKHLTMSRRIQSLAESQLRKTVNALSPEGSFNGAVIVVDNASMNVLAYVGSPDFNDQVHGGQLNGAAIERSPGSLLKPFLYGLGIEKGVITPRKLVYDIERNYDGYQPANFEKKYLGPVPAEEALARSLNVPAVNLEYELGVDGLEAFIRKARLFDKERAKRSSGLSLVLGAYPLSLEELVTLYSALPNQGRLRRLVFFEDQGQDPNSGISLLRPETCFIVSDMLTKLERPDLPQSWEFTASRGKLAFKTGTSFGLRDAWSIGYTRRYTVGVWLGNVNAKGSSALIGIKAAAPLLLSILNDLSRYDDAWLPRAPGVREREVCALSGEPLGPYCTHKRTDYFIPGVSAQATCSVHQQIQVRKKDGLQVCRLCMSGPRKAYVEKTIEIWPPDIAAFFRSRGKLETIPPAHNPSCPGLLSDKDKALRLRSPLPGGFYTLTDALSHEAQRIPLMVQGRHGESTVFWYVDDQLVGEGPPDRVFYVKPIPGRHRVSVMDIRGHFDTAEFNVRRMF